MQILCGRSSVGADKSYHLHVGVSHLSYATARVDIDLDWTLTAAALHDVDLYM